MKEIAFCSFRQQPTSEFECWSAIWSRGAECKECGTECYRNGYSQAEASQDNARIVKMKKQERKRFIEKMQEVE